MMKGISQHRKCYHQDDIIVAWKDERWKDLKIDLNAFGLFCPQNSNFLFITNKRHFEIFLLENRFHGGDNTPFQF